MVNIEYERYEKEYVPKSPNSEDYVDCVAKITECRVTDDPKNNYPDVKDDVRIWKPIPESDERSMRALMYLAKSALTCAQIHQGVPDNKSIENSCSGYAEQYISDVLHDSGYLMKDALKTLMTEEIPHKISDRWTESDITLFEEGLTGFKKKFDAIRSHLLPHKTTVDIVEFYYTWKRTKRVKGLTASQSRPLLLRRPKKLWGLIIGPPTASRITRSQAAPKDDSRRTPARLIISRRNIFTAVNRKRTSAKQTRLSPTQT